MGLIQSKYPYEKRKFGHKMKASGYMHTKKATGCKPRRGPEEKSNLLIPCRGLPEL